MDIIRPTIMTFNNEYYDADDMDYDINAFIKKIDDISPEIIYQGDNVIIKYYE